MDWATTSFSFGLSPDLVSPSIRKLQNNVPYVPPAVHVLDSECSVSAMGFLVVGILTYTAEKHGEVHNSDGLPPTLVVFILRVLTLHKMERQNM